MMAKNEVSAMGRPVVGIIGNSHLLNDRYPVHSGGTMNSAAIAEVAGCLPLLIPTDPAFVRVEELLEICDGFLLTGGRPNVHPSEYGHAETPAHGAFDRGRDAITLPLVRACVARGQPFLGICRGFQEVNVAMGGTLHPEIRDLPGRMNHRMPPGETDHTIIFRKRHSVKLTKGGWFERTLGTDEIFTNSLHGQAVIDLGKGVMVEGVCEDGTVEAISVPSSTAAVSVVGLMTVDSALRA